MEAERRDSVPDDTDAALVFLPFPSPERLASARVQKSN